MKKHHHNFIAESNHGACPLCFSTMDIGEWLSKRASGRVVHLGCVGRASTESDQQQALFTLVSDNELETAIEAKNETIERAKEMLGVSRMVFDGPSCLGVDVPRLAGQLAKVFALMSDGRFRTLSQIAATVGCLETSASARLRDFRKARFGNHSVLSRQLANSPGVYEYQLIVNQRKEANERRDAA